MCIIKDLFLIKCLCVGMYMCVLVPKELGGGQISDAGVMGGCKLSDMGAGA